MSIPGVNREAFEAALKEYLSPTTPVRSPQFLKGREKKLEDIRRALVQSGRQIFIYGDRGVGKTSLAQTAAYEHQSSSNSPILLGCDPQTTFLKLANDLAVKLLAQDPTITKRISSGKLGASLKGLLTAEATASIEKGRIPEFGTMNEAVSVIEFICKNHSDQPVVVIDEFERIKSPEERTLFADFIKQVGDQSIPIKLIFCGVGSALEDLLDTHHSCYRYLATIQLERLGISPCLEIIDAASNSLSVRFDDTTRYRIAKISDGFPHYVHLLTEKLLWEVYDDPRKCTSNTVQHFTSAIQAAVRDIEPHLKSIYDKATKKYTDEYEPILWAVADHYELLRRSTDINDSYNKIMGGRGTVALSREKFNTRMNLLKRETHGAILNGTRQGWYSFSEAVVRGYVRLRAQDRGVILGIDHPLEVTKSKI